jgi:prepilin-type N-terminal cleavage/methylation domain-containing protein
LAKKEKGFTLMELLIAVAIVAVLAGIGIPIYMKLQSGAKATEANANLDGIRTCEESYKMVHNAYMDCTISPVNAIPDETPVAFADTDGDTTIGFDAIGFQPNANVRFIYEVGGSSGIAYTAGALGDTDGDTNCVLYLATQSSGSTQETAAVPAELADITLLAPTIAATD